MQLFYNANITDTKQFTFDKTESRHIVRVLRKKTGDQLFITNGKGLLFNSEISIANDKKCLVTIIKVDKKPKPWNYHLHIAIAPTKSMDRYEWFLEKATEIGIDEITPLLCDHSERKILKAERLEKIIESAMKQSLKFHLPKLNPLIKFSDFINHDFDSNLYIAHCEKANKQTLKSVLLPNQKITILIGPEGDFSSSEIEKAIQQNFTPISLGESRLRTETAGVVATQMVSFINQ
ncbi:MAG: 16S rRNA (uracil(1498)-N(3))-methyltransferase [Flavobacteriaceae bacterium]|nr:16S rRNA (uracil(1498)-N(3))-methyltransferase [Flavobacteriaceae bacterium]